MAIDPIDTKLIDTLLKGYKNPDEIIGKNGLLKQLTKALLERAMSAEMTAHVGYEKHDPAGNNSGNSRNGASKKKLKGEFGEFELETPRDRNGSFEPKIIAKNQTRFTGFDDKIISMYSRGMTTREIEGHLKEMYGVEVSPMLISSVTEAVMEEVKTWQSRPLEETYAILYLDALRVKIRDGGHVQNKAIYVAIAVTVDGERDILGLWAGEGGEGAKFWHHVLTEIKNRGVSDVCLLVCDGLSGLPDAVSSVWPQTIVQTCVVHLLRNSFRYASRRDWPQIAKDLKPIYTAPTEAAALERLADFAAAWEARYPAIVKLWESAWAEFVPFLGFDPEIRTVIYTTNAIESVNARIRKAVKARGHFPTEAAAIKCVYLAIMSLDPTGKGRQRWSNRWKAALNAFTVAFPGRIIRTTK